MTSMTTKCITGSALLSLLVLSGHALAEISQEQLRNELLGSEGRLQQMINQGDIKILDNSYKLGSDLKLIQAEQEKTRQSIQELKTLQQQLAKQLQQQQGDKDTMKNEKKGKEENSCQQSGPGLTTPDGKLILGEAEWVYLEEANGAFQSRVDTGATTSSVSATDITIFEREGKRWVKFKMPLDDGRSLDMEAPYVRTVTIRQASAKTTDDRPVVRMTMQLGSLTEKAEFSLRDRSDMAFPLLLGREFIKDVAVVDVARQFVQPKPDTKNLFTAKKKANLGINSADKKAADTSSKKKAASASKKKEQEDTKKKVETKATPVASTATEATPVKEAQPAAKATPAKTATPAQDKQ
jgi:Uncharacterized protein conserved in archaea